MSYESKVDINGKKLHLTDVIEVETLQKIQDAFADMSGMAALTADHEGNAVTEGSNFTDFCFKYTRKSDIGKRKCELCDKIGAEMTLSNGSACSYYCHAGLVDFAAPIMLDGKMIGSFIGGQILMSTPDLEQFKKTAVELGIDPNDYVKAVKNVRIVSKKTVDKSANFLSTIAGILSDVAYKGYMYHENSIEVEKASHMKSDFLANMSHEIRTPMNAVLGMADMALREDLSPTAREYIKQIKASGKNLLVIINDILDFSKIESGKMEIVEDNYEPLSIVNDLSNIVISRIGDKKIEFIMDISPDIPKKLYGDNVRIYQVILNLLTNAVKFTNEGYVKLKIDSVRKDENICILKISISDTGIGIKEEDMEHIFDSFQQLDSKRNKNIEGTGLGLAISNQLLKLMDSEINIKSVYNEGSTFYFDLPQRMIDIEPTIRKDNSSKAVAALLVTNKYVKGQIEKDLNWVGVDCVDLLISNYLETSVPDMIIVEKNYFRNEIENYVREHSEIKCCIIIDNFSGTFRTNIPNVVSIRKPIYFLNLFNALGISDIRISEEHDSNINMFTAPDANILIVDDNKINLTVAKGVLEPLKMNIDTAESAKQAFKMIREKMYDLIFMDHMMPEIDGVEAVKIIHEKFVEYDHVPIIALTANAVGEAKDLFVSAGMSDFVPKPIEFKTIVSKLRKWLPQHKIIDSEGTETESVEASSESGDIENIPGLDVKSAVQMLGSKELFKTILGEYYSTIDSKTETIRKFKNSGDIRNYTIEVHSLKSTSKQIGANLVSSMAAELESAGNANDLDKISSKTDAMLAEFNKYKEILAPYCSDKDKNLPKKSCDKDKILEMLDQVSDALENFDTIQLDEIVEEMMSYEYSEEESSIMEALKTAAEDSDLDLAEENVGKWRDLLDK